MQHEIAIIGGGPSGSTAAIYLANYGFDVCLIEKKVFPRDILCGEFLSREVVDNLKVLNLYEDFLTLKPNPINSFAMFNGKKGISAKLDFQAFGMKRSAFDNLLLTNAKAKGVTVYQPFEVSEIRKKNGGYILNMKSSNRVFEKTTSQYVIAAYGKRNHLDAKLSRNFISHKSNLNGIKYHVHTKFLKNVKDDQIQIFTSDRIYCGVNTVSDNEVTFCFLENRRNFSKTPIHSLKDLAEKNFSFNSLFSRQLDDVFLSNRVYGSGDIYFGSRNKVEEGIFMIGDAAQVIAPLSGDGISMAMDSAIMLANLFKDKLQKNISDADLYIMYNREWQKNFEKRLKNALFIQSVLFNKFGRKIGVEVLNCYPNALNYFIKNTRG